MPEIPQKIQDLIREKGGIRLDCGAGPHPQPGWVTVDKRALPHIDIVHDLEVVPYPLPDECCLSILLSHVVEHLKPWLMIDLMNEWWRLMKPGGQILLAMPYPTSPGFWQDPTHIKTWNETTPAYFDPDYPPGTGESQVLYRIYAPKPWKIITRAWAAEGNLEIVMEKRSEQPPED